MNEELAAAEISVCSLCGTHVQPSGGPAVLAVEQSAADGLLPALGRDELSQPPLPSRAR